MKKLHIMNDETLSELGMKCLYTAIAGTIFGKSIVNGIAVGLAEVTAFTESAALKGTAAVYIAAVALLYLAFIIVQPVRKINKRNMNELLERGVKSRVKVVEHIKKGIFHPRHRMKCVSLTDPTKEYLTGKNIETYMYKFPVGTLLDLYTDPEDENHYYVDTLAFDTQPTIREMREMMKS